MSEYTELKEAIKTYIPPITQAMVSAYMRSGNDFESAKLMATTSIRPSTKEGLEKLYIFVMSNPNAKPKDIIEYSDQLVEKEKQAERAEKTQSFIKFLGIAAAVAVAILILSIIF